jgi:hypothetical protein
MVTKYTSVYFQTLHKVFKLILLGRPHQLNNLTEFQDVLDEKKLPKEDVPQRTNSVESFTKQDSLKSWITQIGREYETLITDKSNTPRQDWKVRYCQEFPRTPLACPHVWKGLSKTHYNWVTGATANDHVAHKNRIVKALAAEYWFWIAVRKEFVTERPWLHKLLDLIKKQIPDTPEFADWTCWLPLPSCDEEDGVLTDNADGLLVDGLVNREMAANKVKLFKAWKDFSKALKVACGVKDDKDIKKLHPVFKKDFYSVEKVSYNTYHSPL